MKPFTQEQKFFDAWLTKPDVNKMVLVAYEPLVGTRFNKFGDEYLQTTIAKWTGEQWVFMSIEGVKLKQMMTRSIRYWSPWPVFFISSSKAKAKVEKLFKQSP